MALNIKELLALADKLDVEGKYAEAAELDNMLQKLSVKRETPEEKEERLDLEQYERRVKEDETSNRLPLREEEMKAREEDLKAENREKMQARLDQLKPEGYDFMQKLDSLNWAPTNEVSQDVLGIVERLKKAGWEVFAGKDDMAGYMQVPDLPGVRVGDEPELEDFEVPEKTAAFARRLAGVGPLDLPEYQPLAAEPKEEQLEMLPGAQDASMPILGAFKEFLASPEEGHDKLIKLVDDYKSKNRMPEKIETEDDAARHREELEGMTSEELGDTQVASRNFVFEKLADIADRLDALGAPEEAGLIDGFIKKHAEEGDSDYQGEDEKSEQSKRYDSKYHHSLQIREPKTKQERIDREGRDKHHVHTMQSVETTALSTRYCPEHVGVSVSRVGESTYQCSLDGAVFNYETGWTDHDGNEHPGGSIAAQTPDSSGYEIPHRIFDSRENILNRVN